MANIFKNTCLYFFEQINTGTFLNWGCTPSHSITTTAMKSHLGTMAWGSNGWSQLLCPNLWVGEETTNLEMVTIPPIKMVMTGGWFMTLFKPHYLIIQKLWYPCFSILIPNHKCMGYIAIHNSPFILFLELDLAHQTHKKSKLSMSSHQTSNFSFRLDIRPRNWLSNIINCGLCHHQITDHINSYHILSCYIPMLSPWLLFPPKFRKIDASGGEMREPLQHENHVTINHQVFADGFYIGSSHVMPGKNPQPPIRYCT